MKLKIDTYHIYSNNEYVILIGVIYRNNALLKEIDKFKCVSFKKIESFTNLKKAKKTIIYDFKNFV